MIWMWWRKRIFELMKTGVRSLFLRVPKLRLCEQHGWWEDAEVDSHYADFSISYRFQETPAHT